MSYFISGVFVGLIVGLTAGYVVGRSDERDKADKEREFDCRTCRHKRR